MDTTHVLPEKNLVWGFFVVFDGGFFFSRVGSRVLGKFGSRNVYTGGGGLRALFVYGLGWIGGSS